MATEPVPHVLNVFSTFGIGGPQTRFVNICNALSCKYRHTILAMDGNLVASAGLVSGSTWSPASMPVVKSRFVSLTNLRNARTILHRLRPDVLVTYNWGTIEWSLANTPSLCRHIHIEDGFGPDETPQDQRRRRVVARRLLLSRCERIIVPSRTLFDLATQTWRLPPGRVVHIPNGVDWRRFGSRPDTNLLASLGIEGTEPVVGTVTGLRPEKNLQRLLRLFATLPPELEARLVIVGDGPERDALLATATRLGVAPRTILTGAMTEPERLLGRFDVFALTSDTEQMPSSILEAMAAGLPLLATDVGDVKRMVSQDNAAFVLPRDDEETLVRGLLRLLQDGPLRTRLGDANRDHVRSHFDLETMVAHYDDLFRGAA